MKSYVLGFVFSADATQVLLMHKNRPIDQEGKYNGIGGLIEDDEAPSEAMVRECQEESGLVIAESSWAQYAKVEGEGYELFVFTTKITDITDAETMTDEPVSIHSYPEVLVGPAPLVGNLEWLLPMAKSHMGGVAYIVL